MTFKKIIKLTKLIINKKFWLYNNIKKFISTVHDSYSPLLIRYAIFFLNKLFDQIIIFFYLFIINKMLIFVSNSSKNADSRNCPNLDLSAIWEPLVAVLVDCAGFLN